MGRKEMLEEKWHNQASRSGVFLTGVIAMFIALVTTWIIGSHFEAKSYEELTGKKVTTWQAMFLDLRVQSAPKED